MNLNRYTCRQHQKKLVNLLHHAIVISNVLNLPSTAPVRNIKGNWYLDLINSLYFVLSFDSSHGFSANQKDVKIPTLTQATPTIDNGLNLLSINIPEKSISFDLNSLIHSVT